VLSAVGIKYLAGRGTPAIIAPQESAALP